MKDKYIVIPVEELRADQPRWFLHAKATNFEPRNMHTLPWHDADGAAPTHCIVKDESPQWMLSDKAKDFIEDQLLKMEDEIREQLKYMDGDWYEPVMSSLLNKAQEIDELRKVFGLPEKIRKVVKREQMSFVDSLNVSKEG